MKVWVDAMNSLQLLSQSFERLLVLVVTDFKYSGAALSGGIFCTVTDFVCYNVQHTLAALLRGLS